MARTEKQVQGWVTEIKESYMTEIAQLISALESRKNNDQAKSFMQYLTNLSSKEDIKANASRMLTLVKEVQTELENDKTVEFFVDNKNYKMQHIVEMIISKF